MEQGPPGPLIVNRPEAPVGWLFDKNDIIYTTGSKSTEKVHPGWQRGIRAGNLKEGK
jgi:hypothetical protein